MTNENESKGAESKGMESKGVEPESSAVELGAEDTTADTTEETTADAPAATKTGGRIDWARVAAYGVLPALVLILGLAAGYFKYVDDSVRVDDQARQQTLQVAKDSTIALLSYTPDKVEQQLNDARGLLTGEFRESYTSLINDVVIPGAQQKQISAVATIPAAASVVAEPNRAVVLVFVNQTVVVGADAPTNTASSVRVTLEKSDGAWLISSFDPV